MKTVHASRVDLRMPEPVKERLRKVAALSGRSMSDFIVAAALEKADQVSASIERWELDSEDSRVVMAALLNPQNNSCLRALFAENPATKSVDRVES